MTLIEQLLQVVEVYRSARRLSLGRVSTLIFGDGTKLAKLNAGGDLTTARFEGAMQTLARDWPEGAVWPRGVSRPVVLMHTEDTQ